METTVQEQAEIKAAGERLVAGGWKYEMGKAGAEKKDKAIKAMFDTLRDMKRKVNPAQTEAMLRIYEGDYGCETFASRASDHWVYPIGRDGLENKDLAVAYMLDVLKEHAKFYGIPIAQSTLFAMMEAFDIGYGEKGVRADKPKPPDEIGEYLKQVFEGKTMLEELNLSTICTHIAWLEFKRIIAEMG